MAKSFFNDDYSLKNSNDESITIKTTGIAWPADKERLFINADDHEDTQWIDKKDERFINWMRVSATSNFKKLWGRIEEDLQPGEYTLTVENNYDVDTFGGTKGVVFSTANNFGGKNFILSTLYIIFGSISMFIAIAFWVKSIYYPEKLPELKLD